MYNINILQSIIIAVTSGVIVSLINHFLTSKQKREESTRDLKMKAYSLLLDSSRAFLDDPNLSKEQRRQVKSNFL